MLTLFVSAALASGSTASLACALPDGGADRIACWMYSEDPVASGFSSPRGPARAVVAIADGTVTGADGGSLSVRHTFYENDRRREVSFTATGLSETLVTAGQLVRRGEKLGRRGRGRGASATALLVDGSDAEAFVSARRTLLVPQREAVLVVVDVDGHRAVRFERGLPLATYEVAQGQAEGVKQRQGDLKTPRGVYFVVDRRAGDFSGPFGAYYGGYWIKLNYPNAFDAERGLREGLVTRAEARRIAAAWRHRELTPQRTALGGGIGFHGWISEWSADRDGYGLSWGCVVLHLSDIAAFYDAVPLGAMVVLL